MADHFDFWFLIAYGPPAGGAVKPPSFGVHSFPKSPGITSRRRSLTVSTGQGVEQPGIVKRWGSDVVELRKKI